MHGSDAFARSRRSGDLCCNSGCSSGLGSHRHGIKLLGAAHGSCTARGAFGVGDRWRARISDMAVTYNTSRARSPKVYMGQAMF